LRLFFIFPTVKWGYAYLFYCKTIIMLKERKVIFIVLSVLIVTMNSIFAQESVRVLSFNIHHGKDRKSTRLNSSHVKISYAVFCSGHHLDLHSFPTRRSSDLLRLFFIFPTVKWGYAYLFYCKTIIMLKERKVIFIVLSVLIVTMNSIFAQESVRVLSFNIHHG